MATLMDWLMQAQARGYGSSAQPSISDIVSQRQERGYTMPPTVNVPNPMSPTDAVREQMLRQVGVIPDTPVAGGASITTRPAYSQMQSYVGGQDSPIEQLRMRGQGAMPSPSYSPSQAGVSALPEMMAFAPNRFGNLAAPIAATPAIAPATAVAPIQSATSTTAPAAPSIFNRIFGGEDYQSNSMPVVMAPQGPGMTGAPLSQTVNWGDPENAADYFRAAAAAQRIGLL
jgi:hypothetical protein